jgi:hypothetical protein
MSDLGLPITDDFPAGRKLAVRVLLDSTVLMEGERRRFDLGATLFTFAPADTMPSSAIRLMPMLPCAPKTGWRSWATGLEARQRPGR